MNVESLLVANLAATAELLVIAIRRRAPRTALFLAVVIALGSGLLPTIYQGTGISVLVCVYTVASVLPTRAATIATVTAAAVHLVGGAVVGMLGPSLDDPLSFLGNDGSDVRDLVLATIACFAAAAMVGTYAQSRRRYTAELADRLDHLELEREEQARRVIAAERGRIARELHDLAAHDLAAIVVQAGAADHLATATRRRPGRPCATSGPRAARRSDRSAGWSASCAPAPTPMPTWPC